MTPSPTTPSQESALPELANCPFCGGSDAYVERADYSAAYVQCDSLIAPGCACLARGPVCVQESDDETVPGEAGAIAAWNRRATPPIQQGVVEALEEARSCIHMDRTALADTHFDPKLGRVDDDGQDGLNDYDAVLRNIDAALASLRATSGENGNG